MFIIIVIRLGYDRPSGLLLFVPAVLFSIHTPLFYPYSSVTLSYFILAVPMRECLGKHSCMSSPFPIAILNGTSDFLFSLFGARECPASTIIVFVPEVVIKNHLIKKKTPAREGADDSSVFAYSSRFYFVFVCFGGVWMICHFSII